jgi:DNA-directed RNA polymerase specialized sigma24 family protein
MSVQVDSYECPLCSIEYKDERLVRAHISLSEDTEHTEKNGVLEPVYAVTSDGVDEISGAGTIQAANMDEDIPRTAFPASVTETQLAVLRTAVRNANVDSIKEIERRVTQLYDTDVSYQTVRKTVNNYFMTEDESDEESTYDELTAKQRAIVDVMASNQNASYTDVAEIVGVSNAYPQRVEDEYGDVITRRAETLIEMPETPEWSDDQQRVVDVLSRESTPLEPSQSYSEIADEVGVSVDIVSQLLHGHKDGVREQVSTDEYQTKGMTASPNMKQFTPQNKPDEDEQSDKNGQQTVAESHNSELAGETTDTESIEDTGEKSESGVGIGENQQLYEDVISLLENVRAQRRIAETELDNSASNVAVGRLAVAKEVESELEQIIDE